MKLIGWYCLPWTFTQQMNLKLFKLIGLQCKIKRIDVKNTYEYTTIESKLRTKEQESVTKKK